MIDKLEFKGALNIFFFSLLVMNLINKIRTNYLSFVRIKTKTTSICIPDCTKHGCFRLMIYVQYIHTYIYIYEIFDDKMWVIEIICVHILNDGL